MLKITALIKKQSENNVLRWKRKTLIITNYIVEQVRAFLHQNLQSDALSTELIGVGYLIGWNITYAFSETSLSLLGWDKKELYYHT